MAVLSVFSSIYMKKGEKWAFLLPFHGVRYRL